jgi:hypothetical protein
MPDTLRVEVECLGKEPAPLATCLGWWCAGGPVAGVVCGTDARERVDRHEIPLLTDEDVPVLKVAVEDDRSTIPALKKGACNRWFVSLYRVRVQAEMRPEQAAEKGVMR